MSTPFDPRDRSDPSDPIEQELRDSLSAHAANAPDARAVTDRLLAAAAEGRAGGHGPWNRLGLPLLAAACVAAIVGIVIAVAHPGGHDHDPKVAEQPTPSAVTTTVTPPPTQNGAAATATSPSTPDTASSSPSTAGRPAKLQDVKILDLTFTGEDSGWALASAACLTGSGRCTALLRTTDGTTWTSHPSGPFDVAGVDGCPAASCVTNLRFANDEIGYAFGPHALFMTTDGGTTWAHLEGGAEALETLDGNVITVSEDASAAVSVRTAAIGSSVFVTRSLGGRVVKPAGVQLVRSGRGALVSFELAAHAGSTPSTSVFVTDNDGASWSHPADPCSTTGSTGGVARGALATAAGPDGSVALSCVGTAGSGGASSVVVTATGPTHAFTAGAAVPGQAEVTAVASASLDTVVAVSADAVYRTTNRGKTWTRRPAVTLSGGASFAGFESASVGRLVTDGGTTIWTTRDAGRTWKAVRF